MANIMKKKIFYITTPIYYASGEPHIGHAYATVNADLIARYKREMGYSVFFLTGTDEHGEKIQKNAEKENIDVQKFVDRMADSFKKLWSDLGITNDDFIRTSEHRHVETVQKVFTKLLQQKDIYKGKYKGWYCTPCESFFTEGQLKGGHLCPDCGRECHEVEQEAYFLNCKKYVNKLLDFYKKNPNFVPDGKLNEMIKTFIEPGLEDLCITRTNFTWGVPVKEDQQHVVYVWIDALLNYISALGYLSNDESKFNEFWGKDSTIFQLAGREINRFHSIYWPILLFALNLRLPNTIFIHGLLVTRTGAKFSKSLGNAPKAGPIIEKYGLDALRYYLGREVILGDDGNFTAKQFVDRFNIDLVNNYGNLVNRTINMIRKYFKDGKLPSIYRYQNAKSRQVISAMKESIKKYKQEFDNYCPSKAFICAMDIVDRANKYIEDMTPWVLFKENNISLLKEVMYVLVESIRVSSLLLRPALINKADEALDQLGVPLEFRQFNTLNKNLCLNKLKVNAPSALFPRLDVDKETEYLSSLIEAKN